MARLPKLAEVQSDRDSIKPGALCWVVKTRYMNLSRGSWTLDWATETDTKAGGKVVSAVGSGTPITVRDAAFMRGVFNHSPFDEPLHFVVTMNRNIRARAMLGAWIADGAPTFRSKRQVIEFTERHMA